MLDESATGAVGEVEESAGCAGGVAASMHANSNSAGKCDGWSAASSSSGPGPASGGCGVLLDVPADRQNLNSRIVLLLH